jgi:hypothetical protein
MLVFEMIDVVLSSTGVNSKVENFGVGVSLFGGCNPLTLFFSCSLYHGKGDDFSFQASPKVSLIVGKDSTFLGHVKRMISKAAKCRVLRELQSLCQAQTVFCRIDAAGHMPSR